jgi:hypothetical protein
MAVTALRIHQGIVARFDFHLKMLEGGEPHGHGGRPFSRAGMKYIVVVAVVVVVVIVVHDRQVIESGKTREGRNGILVPLHHGGSAPESGLGVGASLPGPFVWPHSPVGEAPHGGFVV